MTSPPKAINPVDTPEKHYENPDDLLKWIFTAVDQINVALNTIQNRLEAGGL